MVQKQQPAVGLSWRGNVQEKHHKQMETESQKQGKHKRENLRQGRAIRASKVTGGVLEFQNIKKICAGGRERTTQKKQGK